MDNHKYQHHAFRSTGLLLYKHCGYNSSESNLDLRRNISIKGWVESLQLTFNLLNMK